MAPIEWTDNGPEGDEKVEFSDNGVRIALLSDSGAIEVFDQWQLDMFGGVLPSIGDRIVTLWGDGDPDPTEHFRVLARYYVGEFAGDNAWWLLVAPEVTSERDARVFQLARDASEETRREAREREAHYDSILEAAREKVQPKARGKSSRKPSTR